MLVPMTQFSMHVHVSDLSIHMYLSMYATWHLYHNLLGSSDFPGSSCPGLEAWTDVNFFTVDQAYFAEQANQL